MEPAVRPDALRLVIEPCSAKPGCFRWAIRAPGGRCVRHSPYSFATRDGAQLSGEMWMRALAAASET